jgi:uncharacterized membrane protein YoaK (UPF0700 family)
MSSERERALLPVLLGLTVVTGLVDAASVLGLGRVFTANMKGNIVFLGFAAAGAPGHSFARSSAAVGAWLLRRSVALVLGIAGVVSALCTFAGWSRLART